MTQKYNFNEHIECVDHIVEVLAVSYPERDNVSIEIWATKADVLDDTLSHYVLADVFCDTLSQKNIAKLFIDGKECNFIIEDLIACFQDAVKKIHR